MSYLDEQDLRKDCCANRPKPCGYHEGFLDGFEAASPDGVVNITGDPEVVDRFIKFMKDRD